MLSSCIRGLQGSVPDAGSDPSAPITTLRQPLHLPEHPLPPSLPLLHSFYPLFPPPRGACLDTSHYAALQLPASPDLLLLPSNLAPFAKLLPLAAAAAGAAGGSHVILGAAAAELAVVAVNPGRLAKGVSGGTFAHVTVAAVAGPEGAGGGGVHERMRVDIRRL